MRAALYTRVSTQEQAEHNYSLEGQLDKLRAYCDLHEHAIAGEYIDAGFSGTTDKRPGLSRLLADVEAGLVDVVIVYRLDRFFRSQRLLHATLYRLETSGAGLVSVSESFDTTTPVGRAMLGVLGTFAQLERDTFIERCQDGKRKAASKGNHTGGTVGYGWRIDPDTKAYVVDPDEAAIVQCLFAWADEGLTTRLIADRLNATGVPTKFNGARGARHYTAKWHPATITAMLHHPAYKGDWDYGREPIKRQNRNLTAGKRPAIVPVEQWERVQTRLAANQKLSKRNTKRSYLLSGLIRCRCGHAYCGSYYDLADGSEVLYYRCSRQYPHEPCDGPSVPASFVEGVVWEDVRGFLERPENVVEALQALHVTEPSDSAELVRIETRIRDLDEQESRLVSLYTIGKLSRPALESEAGRIEVERRGALAIRCEIEQEVANLEARRQRVRDIQAQLERLSRQLGEPTPEQKRTVFRSLVGSVTVGKDEQGHHSVKVSYVFGNPVGTIVTPISKSGAMISAGFAAEQGREVMAVPGAATSKGSEGPHYLVK